MALSPGPTLEGGADTVQRFVFEQGAVRGELVLLEASWQAVLARHDYPPVVRDQLGEALAAVMLLSSTIKFEGTLILQLQGRGALRSVVAQASHQRTLRGLATWDGTPGAGPGAGLQALYGDGRMVLTVQRRHAEPYQGVVALEGECLAEALEHYFGRSEQLPSRLWLAADGRRAAGLFLQALPASGEAASEQPSQWEHLTTLAGTLSREELLELPPGQVLHRLFHQETLRVFEPEAVSFRCSCSRERIERTLVLLGAEEMRTLLEERGCVEVRCEFCNRLWRLDRVDIEQLFAGGFRVEGPGHSH